MRKGVDTRNPSDGLNLLTCVETHSTVIRASNRRQHAWNSSRLNTTAPKPHTITQPTASKLLNEIHISFYSLLRIYVLKIDFYFYILFFKKIPNDRLENFVKVESCNIICFIRMFCWTPKNKVENDKHLHHCDSSDCVITLRCCEIKDEGLF